MNQRKISFCEVKGINESDATIDFIHTKRIVDRDSEVILPAGVNLTEFTKDPVFLWSHNRTIPALGAVQIDNMVKTIDKITAPVKFDVVNDPFADMIFKKYADGFLHAVSISFMPDKMGAPVMDGQKGATIEEWTWLETSAVNIPANPEALKKELEIANSGKYKEFAMPYYDAIRHYSKLGKFDDLESKNYWFVESQITQNKFDADFEEKTHPANFITQLDGSFEWVKEQLHASLTGYAEEHNSVVGKRINDMVSIISTYKDHALFCVVGMDRAYEDDPCFKASWKMASGVPVWKDAPTAVEIGIEIRELMAATGIEKDFRSDEEWVLVGQEMIDLLENTSIELEEKQEKYSVLSEKYAEHGQEPPSLSDYLSAEDKEAIKEVSSDTQASELQVDDTDLTEVSKLVVQNLQHGGVI